MTRPAPFLFLSSALLLAGCPGSLQDPDRFRGEGGTGTCDVEQLFMDTCTGTGCHGAGTPAAGVDLVTAGVAARLVDAPASTTCPGRVEIDSADPANSLILEKVSEAMPSCGAAMPFLGEMLTPEEIACVEEWVTAAAMGGM
jgi:hypothetical protein